MLDYLAQIYLDPYEQQKARSEYYSHDFVMSPSEQFYEFKTRFIHTADTAEIPVSMRFDDLYHKLTIPLRQKILPIKRTLHGNFNELCDLVAEIDFESQALRRDIAAEKKTRALALAATFPKSAPPSASPPAKARPTPAVPLPQAPVPTSYTPSAAVVRTATPSALSTGIKCYNCNEIGHLSRECLKPRRTEIKSLSEDELSAIEITQVQTPPSDSSENDEA